MWNWIMNLWFLICILGLGIPFYQTHKGKAITWREVTFFIYGAFVGFVPLIYVINTH